MSFRASSANVSVELAPDLRGGDDDDAEAEAGGGDADEVTTRVDGDYVRVQPSLRIARRDSGASTLTEATVEDVDIMRFTKPGALTIGSYEVKQADLDVWEFRRVRSVPVLGHCWRVF